MITTALTLLIGAFIGWNFPQPFWAKLLGEKVSDYFKK